MSDLGLELLKRYGVAAVLAAAAIALIVWVLAHFASAPGTPVKVLWGLVEYTKTPERPEPSPMGVRSPFASRDEVEVEAPGEPTPSRSQDTLGPVILGVSHGLSLDEYTEVLSDLRTRHELRELRPIESDRPIKASPPGTFFFVLAFSLDTSITGIDAFLNSRVSRRGSDLLPYFEVHHRGTDEFLLLAYATESDADRIRTLNGEQEFQVTVARRPWEPFTSLVELPFERIASARPRRLEFSQDEDIYALDATIR